MALFSTIWYFCMGGFDDVHGLISAPWQWSVMWDWVASFPWIPALYTGVFSTGLCLWLEVGFIEFLSFIFVIVVFFSHIVMSVYMCTWERIR